ncbi:MAG TPA: aminopeptidase P N-terminal domain-containing protein, partial [Candidatus Limnocylindria bacterium]|nr:aminopeptidase P N-terminal domain-containing protein [Candidatus Limnocylindria bacterium]
MMAQKQSFDMYIQRRKELARLVQQNNPGKQGTIFIFAGFEQSSTAFRQESSFYYLTGIKEPGVVLVLGLDGTSQLYIPHCDQERAKWMAAEVPLRQENAQRLGFTKIAYLGDQCFGYQFHPFFPRTEYAHLLAFIEQSV